MIIVKIIGGLGNQMFQYSYAKSLQRKGHKVKIDISAFDEYKLHGGYQLDKYNIDLKAHPVNFLSKILKKLGLYKGRLIKENSLLFSNDLLRVKDNSYVEGYFQSERYFSTIRRDIEISFDIKAELSNYTKLTKGLIQDASNSVSLHVRRGDYISNKKANIAHGTCDLDYYQRAMSILNSKFNNVKYFVFSDDIKWCKENLKINSVIYVDSEEERDPCEDIYLMSLCRHNIIANSSFSWWGAWLNKNNEKIVVTPKRWFDDNNLQKQSIRLIPEAWIKV